MRTSPPVRFASYSCGLVQSHTCAHAQSHTPCSGSSERSAMTFLQSKEEGTTLGVNDGLHPEQIFVEGIDFMTRDELRRSVSGAFDAECQLMMSVDNAFAKRQKEQCDAQCNALVNAASAE